jgi:hypothetical protein
MLPLEDIEARRSQIAASADLAALHQQLITRAWPLLERAPLIPTVKAELSRDGGVCPDDGSPLLFDPWSPVEHRCMTCGRTFSGERHYASWARAQHLWIAERCAHLATLHVLDGDPATGARARELLAGYFDLYHRLPNRDNVLGPSHLFFSTYLESVWMLDYLAAAFLLREVDALSAEEIAGVDAIAEASATIIAEFNEGMSNRQTWHSAALTAIAAWFGDEDLALTAIEGRTGLLGHLADGFGADGMWHEGENYHLFALRGLLLGLQWSRIAGAELLANEAAATHLSQALMAPADTSLPDFTFPARKDARFGVSLAHPAYLECWEAGLAWLGDRSRSDATVWLATLYQQRPQAAAQYDAYLHDSGLPLPDTRARSDLSSWALWMMQPTLPAAATPWVGASCLLPQQGLAVLRHGAQYWSVECGNDTAGVGHGHPDRLHLTGFVDGSHWLPDPGTGSYVTRDLFWYRSTLAHNAPLIDGLDQPEDAAARCDAFATRGDWAWVSANWAGTRRSVVVGPDWTLDMLRHDGDAPHRLDVPWHVTGEIEMLTPGTWHALDESTEFVDHVERFEPDDDELWRAHAISGAATLALWFAGDGELLRADGPGLPGRAERRAFLLRRAHANHATFATVLDRRGGVTGFAWHNNIATVTDGNGVTTVQFTGTTTVITRTGTTIELAGIQPLPAFKIAVMAELPPHASALAVRVDAAPTLNGTLQGFRCSAPLRLNEEYHYFRSEEPYPGPDAFSATAYVNWSDDAIYLAIEVRKSDVVLRDDAAPSLAMDNEAEDINADGIQVYIDDGAWLLRPSPNDTLTVRAMSPLAAAPLPSGAWQHSGDGYRITARIPVGDMLVGRRDPLPFDLIVNEMRPGRARRAGQLVWSGGPGWVYLRGDRQPATRFGTLELAE